MDTVTDESLAERTTRFAREVRAEVKKVVWPDWQRTGYLTVAVIGIVIIVGVLIFAADTLFRLALGI